MTNRKAKTVVKLSGEMPPRSEEKVGPGYRVAAKYITNDVISVTSKETRINIRSYSMLHVLFLG